jgi:hypothetical protein
MYGTFYYYIPSKFRLPGNVGISVSSDGNSVTVLTGTPTVGLFGVDSVSNRLVQFTSVGDSGAATIFPSLQSVPTTIVPSGGALFRLSTNESKFNVDEFMEYAITVPIHEAI